MISRLLITTSFGQLVNHPFKKIEKLGDNGIKVTFSCVIEIEGQEKPACVAEFLAALFE